MGVLPLYVFSVEECEYILSQELLTPDVHSKAPLFYCGQHLKSRKTIYGYDVPSNMGQNELKMIPTACHDIGQKPLYKQCGPYYLQITRTPKVLRDSKIMGIF